MVELDVDIQSGLEADPGVQWQHLSWAGSAAGVANGGSLCQAGRQGATRHDKRLRRVPHARCLYVCVVAGLEHQRRYVLQTLSMIEWMHCACAASFPILTGCS